MQTLQRMPPARRRSAFVAALLIVVVVAVVALAVGGFWSSARSASPTPLSTAVAGASSSSAIASVSVATETAPASTAPSMSAAPSSGSLSASPTDAANSLPDFDHIYVIILENKEYGRIVGSKDAPYMNSLVAQYEVATDFLAETHPSEPNYIALTSGGLQGANSDGTYNLGVSNLFDQIEASGRTWRTYAQGYPGNCYTNSIASAVADGPGAVGDYVRKHNPAMSYTSISRNPARCANIVKLAGFDPAAANFEMIIPNEINDMHSSSVAAGDAFLKAFVPSIISSPAFANSVLFITFDEGDSNVGGGGRIATIICSPGISPAGYKFTPQVDHYGLLRTIEQAWSMPFLGQAATATTIEIPK